MARWQYTKGLHDIGNGSWAYLQPDGGWGWSNSGLITDSGESLLVDTLFDLKLTREMLTALKAATPAAHNIGTLVNTHANSDHTFGNQLVTGARIVTTESVGEAMAHEDPARVLAMTQNPEAFGEVGAFMSEVFAPFDFRGIELPPAHETFTGALELKVGNKTVQLIDVGPAHTPSDVLVHVPEDRIVYTGDILFVGGHPVIWAGPVRSWVTACDLILSWDVDVVVPGHGPISDKAAVRNFRTYLVWLEHEARQRYDAGLSYEEAAYDIDLTPYADWIDAERLPVNLLALYRDFSGGTIDAAPGDGFAAMARYYRKMKAEARGCADPQHRH